MASSKTGPSMALDLYVYTIYIMVFVVLVETSNSSLISFSKRNAIYFTIAWIFTSSPCHWIQLQIVLPFHVIQAEGLVPAVYFPLGHLKIGS